MSKEAERVPDYTQVAVAQAGAIPPLVALLTSGTPDAQEGAAAALGNIAGSAIIRGRVKKSLVGVGGK